MGSATDALIKGGGAAKPAPATAAPAAPVSPSQANAPSGGSSAVDSLLGRQAANPAASTTAGFNPGAADPLSKNYNAVADKSGNPFAGASVSVLSAIGNVLGRPGQAVLRAAEAGREQKGGGEMAKAAAQGAFGAWDQPTVSFTQATQGHEAKGIVGKTAEFAGSTLTDPLTFLTVGAGAAGEQASKVAAEQAAKAAIEDSATKAAATAAGREAASKLLAEGAEKEAAQAAGKAAGNAVLKDAAEQAQKDTLKAISEQGAKKALTPELRQSTKEALMQQAEESGATPRRSLAELLTGASKDDASERFANRALKSLDETGRGGLRVHIPGTDIGRSLIPQSAIDTAAEKLHLPQLAEKASSSAVGRTAERLFQPGAALKQELGKETGTAAQDLNRARDTEAGLAGEAAQRRVAAAQKLVEGGVTEDQASQLHNALETNNRAALDPNLHGAYDALDKLRNESAQTLTGARDQGQMALFNPGAARSAGLSRLPTPEFKKLLRDPSVADQVKAITKVGAGKSSVVADMTTRDANTAIRQKLVELGKVKPGQKFNAFHENPFASTLGEAQKAGNAASEQKYIEGLKGLKDPETGASLIQTGEKPAGYKSVTLEGIGKIHAPPSVAADIERVQAITHNDAELAKVAKAYKSWEQWWKGSATTLPVGGSFTARNARSNFFNNFLAGITTPAPYIEAGKIQKAIREVQTAPGFREMVANGEFDKALEQKLGARTFKRYQGAVKNDVLNSSFTAADLGANNAPGIKSAKDAFKDASAGGKAKMAAGQLGKDSKLLEIGMTGNEIVENNARLAHYLGKLDELGNSKAAADSVKKFLFDYKDLTPFESKGIKRVMPFYTYMRKNTPLQIEQLFKNPGKYAMRQHLADSFLPSSKNNGDVPGYMASGHVLPGYLAKLLGADASKPLVTTPDNPLSAAADSVTPLVHTAGIIPGLKNAVPTEARPSGGGSEVARDYYNVLGGPGIGALNYGAQEATGKSTYTGGKLQGSALTRAAGAATPAYGRAGTLKKGPWQQRALRALTGVKTQQPK